MLVALGEIQTMPTCSAHLCSESCAIKALSKWMASLQSANAGKSQAANDSPEERQTISDQRLKKVLDL